MLPAIAYLNTVPQLSVPHYSYRSCGSGSDRGSFLGVRRPGREVDDPHPSIVDKKSKWSYTSTPILRFHGVDRDRFDYTGCPRRNGQNFGRVFLMLNYTDITQNTYIQSWTEIMAREKCGLLGCPRTVRRPWRHTNPLRKPGNEKPLANVAMQWPWRDYASAAACVKCLVTLRTNMTWVRVFL